MRPLRALVNFMHKGPILDHLSSVGSISHGLHMQACGCLPLYPLQNIFESPPPSSILPLAKMLDDGLLHVTLWSEGDPLYRLLPLPSKRIVIIILFSVLVGVVVVAVVVVVVIEE